MAGSIAQFNWSALQNGADIRGVALEGVPHEPVNLTPDINEAIRLNWESVPKTYEGVRVACQSPEENGWFSLRLSLHDPVLPLNVESNTAGGVARIVERLQVFFAALPGLNRSALEE